jgi:uncharacterized protein (TIGR03435 family)
MIAYGQTETPRARSQFEVASIKPNAGLADKAYVQPLPGRLLMQNFTPRTLILLAYGIENYQIFGGPSWIASDHYDIQAKAEGNASIQQMEGPMLQALLEDRFKLTLHGEMKQVPVYELSTVNGKGKLKPSEEGSCVPYDVDAPPPAAPARGQPWPTFCGYPRTGIDGHRRTLDGKGMSIADLARSLARSELRRPVIDKTGLTGMFDLHLEWTTDSPNGLTDPDSTDTLSILTALREQLGLRLDAARGPVEVLVIDRMEKPSAN